MYIKRRWGRFHTDGAHGVCLLLCLRLVHDLGSERSADPGADSLPPSDEYMDAKAPSELSPGRLASALLRCGGRPGASAGGYPRCTRSLYTCAVTSAAALALTAPLPPPPPLPAEEDEAPAISKWWLAGGRRPEEDEPMNGWPAEGNPKSGCAE